MILSWGYNRAQILLNRIIHYYDLNPNQENFLEQKIVTLLVWHKIQELLKIGIFLSGFNERFQDDWTR